MKERTRFGNTLFMNSHIDIFNLAHGAIHAFVEELWEFRPDFLLVNPTYLQIFGSRAKALDLELPPVELVLSSYQYMSNLQRKVLSRLTNAPVYNIYTATELCGCQLGVECSHGNWHVREDHSFLEVVDGDGAPSEDQIGNLLVTTHANQLLPLVRYRIGDLGRSVGHGMHLRAWRLAMLRASRTGKRSTFHPRPAGHDQAIRRRHGTHIGGGALLLHPDR